MTIDPDRMHFRKIDREIRRSQNGQGGAYYAQLPIDRIPDLGTFIAKSDYEVRIESDEYNRKACICASCKNYGKFPADNKQLLFCSPETEISICIIASAGCICRKCPVHKKSYLRKEYYCGTKTSSPKNDIKHPDIIFVSDRYISGLSHVISSGLSSADNAGYKNVALPPIRYEVMWKEVESSNSEKNREIAIGLKQYFLEHPEPKIESIKIIVDDDPVVYTELILEIEKHKILKAMLKNKRPGISETLKTILGNKKRSIFGI